MRNKGFASILDKYSRVMLLLVIIIGMSILRPDAFLTWSNMSTVIFQQAPFTMLMSFGMTLAIITKGIDTSMGSVLVLSSVLVAGFIKSGNMVLGIVMALCIGAACGALNGVLITRVGIAPFIATYGVDWVALGLAFVYTGGVYIYDFPEKFRSIANGPVSYTHLDVYKRQPQGDQIQGLGRIKLDGFHNKSSLLHGKWIADG